MRKRRFTIKRRSVLLGILVLGLVFVGFNSCFGETVSRGIKVVPEKGTVYANQKGMWRYTLKLSSDTEGPVTVKKFVSKLFTMKGEYVTHHTADKDKLKEWDVYKLYSNKPKTFQGGFSSKSDIHFEDYIFIGTDEEGNEVRGAARVHFLKEKRKKGVGPFFTNKSKDIWEKKWSQQPGAEVRKHRVDDPGDYNVVGLRVNADFKIDLGKGEEEFRPGTYWVPAASLGTPDYTKEEILSLRGKPQEAKREIDVLFEALAFIHLCTKPNIHNAKTTGREGINWEFPKPAKPAIRDGTVNCASAANIIRYLLEGDYQEVGYLWRHTAKGGGHVTSYVKHKGNYYFFDAGSLAEKKSSYPVEDGDTFGYHDDKADYIIQCKPEDYIVYWSQISPRDQAIFAMFQSKNNDFALGNKGTNLYYPYSFDGSNLTIWEDPKDDVKLLRANYDPIPPKNQYGVNDYSDYLPYSNYTKLVKEEKQVRPKISEFQSDG